MGDWRRHLATSISGLEEESDFSCSHPDFASRSNAIAPQSALKSKCLAPLPTPLKRFLHALIMHFILFLNSIFPERRNIV